jgi:hypothetical protein
VSIITTKQFMHMKKILLLLIVLFVGTYGFCQTAAKSYKAPVKSYKAPVKSYKAPAKTSQSSTVKYQTPVVTSPASAVTAPTPVVASQAPVAASPVPVVVAQNPVVQPQAPVNSYNAPVNSHQTSAASSQAQPVSCRTNYDANQTTEEEYNYITNILKSQMDGNYDMKKNYELKTVKVMNSYQKRVELGQLIRTADKSIACYWIKFTNFKTYYYCLPNPHSTTEMMNKCGSDLRLGMSTQNLSMFVMTLLSGLDWQAKL